MDFITHALVGAGVGRLVSPKREWAPQLCLAGVLASELQDADFWLYLIDPNYYGRYHRVASHNLWALALVALASAGLAWGIARVRPWRRFGWFVHDNLPKTDPLVDQAPWRWMLIVALLAAYLHLLYDCFTGFGNIEPLWPWSAWDPSFHAVTSFDTVVLAVTVAWHVSVRYFNPSRKGEIGLTILYGFVLAAYIGARLLWGEPTVW